MIKNKKIIIIFLGNVFHDSRTNNLSSTLKKARNKTLVVSCDWLTEKNIEEDDLKTFGIKKGKFSILFYLKAYLIFAREIISAKPDYCFAEDVFTLPVCAILKFFLGYKLIYDCRELYPFLAGLREKKINQTVIRLVEKLFITSANKVMVTGKMDKEFIEKYYGLNNVLILRNLPQRRNINPVNIRKIFNINNALPILIYQGVLLEGRGIPLIIKALEISNNFNFLILGDGPFKNKYEALANNSKVKDKIIFAGRISQSQLLNYTASATIGLSIIENLTKSYYYALPNKLFEYLMAGLPVIISPLPQMAEIVNKYKVGEVIDSIKPEAVAQTIDNLINDPVKLELYGRNALKASEELNWENEFNKINLE